MTELNRSCPIPVERADFALPTESQACCNKMLNEAFPPSGRPVYDSGWIDGGPVGGGPRDFFKGGGGFEKLPGGCAPYLTEMELIGSEKPPINKWIGPAAENSRAPYLKEIGGTAARPEVQRAFSQGFDGRTVLKKL